MLDYPMYPAAMAARLTGLSAARVRRWLKGYDYSYTSSGGEVLHGHSEPVVSRGEYAQGTYASFLNLVDLLFVKRFLDHGVSLQKLRLALQEAQEILGERHFARKTFFTAGQSVYLRVRDEGDAILELLSGGQWVIPEVILSLAHQVEFDRVTGFAERWYPLGPEAQVLVDPRIAFGQPSLIGHGIQTANIYDLFLGEGRNARRVARWMHLDVPEVVAAVTFEEQLAAA